MLYESLLLSPRNTRQPPRPTKHMRQHGKIKYFTYWNWWFFSFSLAFLDFLIFSSLGPVTTILKSDSDSLACLAARARSQSSLGCPGCSNIAYRSSDAHMRKKSRPWIQDNYLKYHSYEPETLFNRRSSIRSPMEKLLESISSFKFHWKIGFRVKISEFVIFHKN